jgi:A/G-specific adenine glycosylase
MKRVSHKMNKLPSLGDFAENLLKWWKNNKRDFPWRKARDPYKILVSEILLHRTRASQVTPIYLEFLDRFPTIAALSETSIENVRRILYPLGLSWRTELLHKMGLEIMKKYEGKIPFKRKELEALPGVGHYIAAAVRCFCHGYPEVLLDTNTVRIIGRVFGIEKTDGSRRSKQFRELYESLIDQRYPREFNYAMIDLGALLCKPRNPVCNICPLSKKCKYGTQKDKEKAYPRKNS